MENCIKIGAELSADTAVFAAGAAVEVMKAQFDYRSSDAVTLHALEVIAKACSVEGVGINGCNFTGEDRKVVVEQGEKQ